MQTTGGVGAILSVLVGLLGGKPQNWVLLRSALLIGGIAFVLLAFLGFRLGKRQDDCERSMGEIETCLHSMGYAMVARMPTGAKTFGARKAIVFFLIALGTVLAAIGLVRW
jgi:hypothetical protein